MYLPFVICYVWKFTVSSSPTKTWCTGKAQGTAHEWTLKQWKVLSMDLNVHSRTATCHFKKNQTTVTSTQMCVWMSLSVFCLCTCLCWMFVQSPTKKKQALMHIDRLFRSLSGVLYWFRGLTFRTVPVWRVNRIWQASCTTTRPIRG